MVIEENEHIDTSEHCKPEDIAAILANRKRRGDDIILIDGNMTNVSALLPIDVLRERGAISQDEYRVLSSIFFKRRAMKITVGLEKLNQSQSVRVESDSTSIDECPLLYLMVAMHRLNRWQINLIDRVTEFNGQHRQGARTNMAWVSHCMSSLKETIGVIEKNLDNAEEITKRYIIGDSAAAPKFYPAPDMRRGF